VSVDRRRAGPRAARGRVRRLAARLEFAYGPRRWSSSGPALDELVATVLSQHTNDTNSGAAYRELAAAFGDWEAVLRAPTRAVAEAIRTAGLANVKALRIQQILRRLRAERGDLSLEFLAGRPAPEARAYLAALPGVGPKTAACVLLFSFGMPVLPVDTHVHRVSARLGLIGPTVNAERAHDLLASLVPADLVYAFHLLMIEHGRRVCHARRPACRRCLIRRGCRYNGPED
jgi:endonuclease-3